MRPRIYKTVEEAKEANKVKSRERMRRFKAQARPQYIFLLENPLGGAIEPTPSSAKGWQAVPQSIPEAAPEPSAERKLAEAHEERTKAIQRVRNPRMGEMVEEEIGG